MFYPYKPADGRGVDVGKAHERNHGPQNDTRGTANRHLKRIHYGNRTPVLDHTGGALAPEHAWPLPRHIVTVHDT